MNLKSRIYELFDKEGIRGIRRASISFKISLHEGVTQENIPNLFIPSSEYYGVTEDTLESLILEYVYDTTGFNIPSVQDLKTLKNINGVPFILELNSENSGDIIYTLAKRHIQGSVRINDSEIISLGNIEEINGDLALLGSSIKDLGNLKKVTGSLWVAQYYPCTNLENLGKLEFVGKDLYLKNTPIKSLSILKKVGGTINLRNTQIESLGELEYVGDNLYLPSHRKHFFDFSNIIINKKIRYYK